MYVLLHFSYQCAKSHFSSFFHSFILNENTFFFFSFRAAAAAAGLHIWSSPARDQIQAAVVTYTAGAATRDPSTHGAHWESNLCPGAAEVLPILLYHSGNSVN